MADTLAEPVAAVQRPDSLAARARAQLRGHVADFHASPPGSEPLRRDIQELLFSPRQQHLLLAAKLGGEEWRRGLPPPVAPRGISVQRQRGLDTTLVKPRSMTKKEFSLWRSVPPVIGATSRFPIPPEPDINEGREALVRFSGWPKPKPADSLLQCRIMFLPESPVRSMRGDCVFSSMQMPVTAEIFRFQMRDLQGRTTLMACDLRQRMPGYGFVGDIKPCHYAFAELKSHSGDGVKVSIDCPAGTTRLQHAQSSAKEYSLSQIKALNLELTIQLVSDESGDQSAEGPTPDRLADSVTQISGNRMDHRLLNSNASQAVEMKYYLNGKDFERAKKLLDQVIMPQVLLSPSPSRSLPSPLSLSRLYF